VNDAMIVSRGGRYNGIVKQKFKTKRNLLKRTMALLGLPDLWCEL
jgi:hypothetical protein